MSRTEQPAAEWLSGLTAVSSIGAGDKFAVLQGGVVKSATDSNIKALIGEPTSQGDFNISTTSQTVTLASAFSAIAVGDKIRYSWHSGDGSNTFSFSDGASYTLNGITADNYIGQGVGHLDIVKTATTTGNIINAGEIWDNDGGNFTDGTFQKFLDGSQKAYCYINKDNASASAQTFNQPIAFISITVSEIESYSTAVGLVAQFNNTPSNQLTTYGVFIVTMSTGAAATNQRYCGASFAGRWTTSYPRIT
jgi:hypothetical protein